jgi:ArsR family transcriptional regulator
MAKATKADDTKPGRTRPRVKARKRPAGAERHREPPTEISAFDPDRVERVLDALPPEDAIGRMADRLQGLAHPSKVQALMALSVAELCVGDVAAVLGLSLSATSTMLKQLRALGYVTTRHAGKQTYYKSASQAPRAVFDVLAKLDEGLDLG